MSFLKELVATLEYREGVQGTFALLERKLAEMHLPVQCANRETGEIVVRCPSLCFNLLLWRCWSDNVLLHVEDAGAGRTRVQIYALPNLLKIRAREDELVDLRQVIAALQAA